MKLSDELKQKLETAKAEAKEISGKDNATIEEIQAKSDEIKTLKAKIELAEQQEDEEAKEIENKAKKEKEKEVDNMEKIEDKTKKNANYIRAIMKKCMHKPTTEAENALLVGGSNEEGYLLPQEIITTITKLTRSYRSLATVLGHMPVTALTGSFPIEDFESVTELVEFVDGTAVDDISDIKFKNVTFALKEKAGFISLSNTLLNMTDNDLIAYVSDVFARKLAVTQNKMGITVLESNKTAKSLADWKALKKSINKDLGEAVKSNMNIMTNQDGYDMLDSALDTQGRPVLQPNPTNPTQKLFMGYPVVVFDNSLIPTTGTTTKLAPVFYGDLSDAVKFVDNGQYAFATDASVGFLKNITVARVITYMDCVQVDASDKCYCYGNITIA